MKLIAIELLGKLPKLKNLIEELVGKHFNYDAIIEEKCVLDTQSVEKISANHCQYISTNHSSNKIVFDRYK
jgi:hypothetical protein